MSTDYFTTTCTESTHVFALDDEDHVQAYHVTATDAHVLCEAAEFRFKEMRNDELTRLYECPWCLSLVEQKHIQRCMVRYKAPYTEAEIRDCYSDPTERAKRDSLLREQR